MRDFIRKMLSDSDGTPSTIRVATMLVIGNVMLVWSYANIVADKWVPMDLSTTGLILTLLGAKVIQKNMEG